MLNNPLLVLHILGWYALGASVLAVLAMLVSILRVTALDVLAMRRESARATREPFWLRFKLDLVAIIVMAIGYAFSLYTTSSDALDARSRLLLYSPLVLARAVFTVLAVLLLFLRFFPLLLRFGSRLTQRLRGAAPVMALAQLARSPRRSLRLALLLALTTSLTIFTLVFNASQSERARDVAAFKAGADISGTPVVPVDQSLIDRQEQAYRKLPGISSASLGCTNPQMWGGSGYKTPATLLAMDAATFAQTATWPGNNSQQPIQTLMHQFVSQRQQAIKNRVVPALVDSRLWQQLHLSPGSTFTLIEGDITAYEYHFMAVARIQQVPTITSSGALLVDFQTFATMRHDITNVIIPALSLNTVWLRVQDNPQAWEQARSALQDGVLTLKPSALQDRLRLIDALYHEPLTLNIIGVLLLGSITALVLVLFGALLSSWLSARGRLVGFAVLRALGAAPHQVAGVLSWQELLVYIVALLLGVLLGAFLSASVIPSLLFTSAANLNIAGLEFYLLQNIPPVQIVVPSLAVVSLAAIVGICIVALGMMVRVVSHPSISQVLRLNED